MKPVESLRHHTTRLTRLVIACAAVALASSVLLPQPARAGHVTPPPVPANLVVPAGNEAFLEGHAVGTQDYICLPSGAGFAWTFFGPQATLFNDHAHQIITHFPQPEPG